MCDLLLHSDKEEDIIEVETALYFAPKLEQIIISKFSLQNYGLILKIEGLDPVVLLRTTTKVITNKRHFTSSEVNIEYLSVQKLAGGFILVCTCSVLKIATKSGQSGTSGKVREFHFQSEKIWRKIFPKIRDNQGTLSL